MKTDMKTEENTVREGMRANGNAPYTPWPTDRPEVRRRKLKRLFDGPTAVTALKNSFVMLRPDIQWKNPVMFVVEVGTILTLIYVLQMAFGASKGIVPIGYFIALDVWLFLTVLFANFATSFAEARGKAQAESLRKARKDTIAHLLKNGSFVEVPSSELKPGDRVAVEAGQVIPGDGEVIEGIISAYLHSKDNIFVTPAGRTAWADQNRFTQSTFTKLIIKSDKKEKKTLKKEGK